MSSLSASRFVCLFQTLLPFPFVLPLCIPWTLSFCLVLYAVIHYVFLCFSASPSHSLSPSLPFLLPHKCCSFFLCLKWMVFLRKSAADCCRARGPECHRSRLIYPPPLSSCYAWSLNFPFLLFFPCFFSQIPPLALPDFSLHLPALIFLCCHLILLEHDTCSVHATGFIFSLWAYSDTWKYDISDSLMSPNVMYSVHIHTWEHFLGHICVHCRSFSTAALPL